MSQLAQVALNGLTQPDWSCSGSGSGSGNGHQQQWAPGSYVLAATGGSKWTHPTWLAALAGGWCVSLHFITPLSIESNRLSPDNFPVTSGKLSHNCSLHFTESVFLVVANFKSQHTFLTVRELLLPTLAGVSLTYKPRLGTSTTSKIRHCWMWVHWVYWLP